ncbi:MAG: bifunctional acyl-CoA synthetase/GNAT family N-acetyltransferase, partial [Planctomycetaceae bacterium]
MVLRNLITTGFNGVVYPVNSQREAISGILAYPRVSALPRVPDLAVICTPSHTVPGLVRDCGEAGVRGLVILSAGFREGGQEGKDLEDQITVERKKFPNLRIIGPNCLGVIAPHVGLNASFAADTPRPGHIALISQSGALCTSLLDWAVRQQIGFSHFVSIGNMLDVGFGDLIDYFGEDPHTKSIILYVESITDARGFMSAARAFSRSKPIVAYKAGRFLESAHAAASHTGAMAGEDSVCNAAFERAGIERVYQMGTMFDCAELLAGQKLPRGPRLAIVTNAGGPGVMATDSLIEQRGVLARLGDGSLAKLSEVLPPWWSHGNPVDVLGDAGPERFAQALAIVLADEHVDAVLVVLTPQSMTDPTQTAEKVTSAAAKSSKPVLATWIGGSRVAEGNRVLTLAGIPTYPAPEAAVEAFMHLVSYARNREILYETPRDVPVSFGLDLEALRGAVQPLLPAGVAVVSEADSKKLLEIYGIPVIKALPARSVEEAVSHADAEGYPIVLKIWSPDISHKTDVGGVALGLRDADGVRAAYSELVETVRKKRPQAQIWGVTVQRQADLSSGLELIVGMKKDPTFGAIMLVGSGGITAELGRDRALALPPLNERLARRMVESLQLWPLMNGFRGRPPLDVEALIETLIRLSYLTAHNPEIAEFDVNPLLVLPRGVLALDARVVIDKSPAAQSVRPFHHLAIRPYPEEFVKPERLASGLPVLLRPIRPEDEPLWLELVDSCSPETLHARFRYLFKRPTHETAARFCVLDYDRELAIMAEIEDAGRRRFIGVGRLVADANHDTAEYAVLVADKWQNQGLGLKLTEYCFEIARKWGIRTVVAETTQDNSRMLSIFEQQGFETLREPQDGIVEVQKSVETPGQI